MFENRGILGLPITIFFIKIYFQVFPDALFFCVVSYLNHYDLKT